MKKHPIKKLLAVVTFVSAASTAIAAPRTLANGAPAPGNTVAKSDDGYMKEGRAAERRAETSLNEARLALAAAFNEERAAVAAIVARPRVHANGAPACGNANAKPVYGGCNEEIADKYMTMRIQRVMHAGDLVVRARARLATVEKAFAKYADVIEPRLVAMEVVP